MLQNGDCARCQQELLPSVAVLDVYTARLLFGCCAASILQAGAVVQQSLSQIRTVAAYNGEEAAHSLYNSKLDVPQKVRSVCSWQESCKHAAAAAYYIYCIQACLCIQFLHVLFDLSLVWRCWL